jgi:hypothetical protein
MMADHGDELAFVALPHPAERACPWGRRLVKLTEPAGLDLEMFHDHPHYPGFLEYGLSTFILAGDKRRPDTGTAAGETTARPKWRP